jgi:uncharacterized protein VirK/YbjX
MVDMTLHAILMKKTYTALSLLPTMDKERLAKITQRMISGNYCGKNFSLKEKLAAVRNHYQTIDKKMISSFLRAEADKILLWERTVGLNKYNIKIMLSDHPAEGELSMLFSVNESPTYTISFTLVNAAAFGFKNGLDTMLLTRVQGVKGSRDNVHLSIKENHQSYPTFLIFAATQGFAKAINYKYIVGICSDSSLNYKRNESVYYGAYNDFWCKLGGFRISKSYFQLPAEIKEKHMGEVSSKHKKRTERRHELKVNIERSAFLAITSLWMKTI